MKQMQQIKCNQGSENLSTFDTVLLKIISTIIKVISSCLYSNLNSFIEYTSIIKSQNFIGLLSENSEIQDSCKNKLMENLPSSTRTKAKTLQIDPLQIHISLKLQSLLCKPFENKGRNHKKDDHSCTTSESIISEADLQDLSRMLVDFTKVAKKKPPASLTKDYKDNHLNGSVVTENVSQLCNIAQSLPISHKKILNKILQAVPHSQNIKDSNLGKKFHRMGSSKEIVEIVDIESNDEEDTLLSLSDPIEPVQNFLDIELSCESDVDSPSSPSVKYESDEDIVVLGEKHPTYEEITLDEDEDGEIHEIVVEKQIEKPKETENEIEEVPLKCPKCDKHFRMASFLKFHIQMHGNKPPSISWEQPSNLSTERNDNTSEQTSNENQRKRKNNHKNLSTIKKIR
ncbi:uncharacterized protein CDAR_622771 [Caerostris darwini]|uniref:C2H2-type domain-containing protein n=1 Tax=Caerostris darwini TaxID=1538125 RepID=A0AAV4TB56_9ARAC|nr:uncharacterized protein CDAR_622771 [Caerostris darwini]